MKKVFLVLILFSLVGCAEIKPMQLPQYNPPDFSAIKRPVIPVPVEGKDYTIDLEKNTVTYTVSGQDLLTAKAISERSAWVIVDMMKQIFDVQTQIIRENQQLIITIDLKRQYAEKQKVYADVEKYAAEIIAIILVALTVAL